MDGLRKTEAARVDGRTGLSEPTVTEFQRTIYVEAENGRLAVKSECCC